MNQSDNFHRDLYDRSQAIKREVDALEKLVMAEIDVQDLPETRPSEPQATIPTGAGVDYRLEPLGWQAGLMVEPTMLTGQYRLHCPANCKSSEVYDIMVFDGNVMVKCRRCKFEYFAKRDGGDKYIWKAVPHD